MLLRFAAFNTACNKQIPDALLRPQILAAAVALAVVNQAALPTAAVNNPSLHFAEQVLTPAGVEISNLNESLIFDCRSACDYARMFWMVRYNAAHPVARAAYGDTFSFFDNLSGVAFAVPPAAKEFLDVNKSQILALAADVQNLLCELKPSRDTTAVAFIR